MNTRVEISDEHPARGWDHAPIDTKSGTSLPLVQTAALSDREMSALTTQALIRQLRSIHMPVYAHGVLARLKFLKRDTLERMLFLGRRYCRNRLAANRCGPE